jgi:hypothetical protein
VFVCALHLIKKLIGRVFFAVLNLLAVTPVIFYTRTRACIRASRTRGVDRSKLQALATSLVLGVVLAAGLAVTLVHPANAVASTTLNFQAKLEGSDGAIAADGNYNVQFKLYNAATGGTALWTEDHLNSASNGLRLVDGYLTVELGSVTAFPNTIPWDQSLYVTMNIGGTSTGVPAYDGEMNPRLKLTAVPYAFQAHSADQLQVSNAGFVTTLTLTPPSTSSITITTPNLSGTLCLENDYTGCGFASAAGSNGYIQNSTSLQGSANFNIRSSATTAATATLQALTGQTADLITFRNAANTANTSGFNSSGQLYYQSGSFQGTVTQATLAQSTVYSLPDPGYATAQFCLLYNGGGSNCAGAGAGITGTGTINRVTRFNSGSTVNASQLLFDNDTIVGVGVTSGSGLLNVSGTSTTQTGLYLTAVGSATAASAVIRDATGQTGDLLQFQNASNTPLTVVGADGSIFTSATATVGSASTLTGTTGQLNVKAAGGANIGQVIRAGTSQTGDLLSLQNSSGTVKSGFNSNGELFYNSGSFTGSLTQATLAQSTVYTLPDPGYATAQFCLLYNGGGSNCAGAGAGITGTGTNNYVARFNSGTTINASSILFDNSTIVGVGATSGIGILNIKGGSATQTSLYSLGATSASVPVTVIRGGASPGVAADLLNLQVDGGSTVAAFDRSGNLTTTGSAQFGTGLTVVSGGAAIAGTTTITGATTVTGAASINTTGTANTSIGNATGSFSLASSGLNVTTAGALSGITTLVASGALTAATTGNTINGLVVNSGALSAITGYTQASGNFAISGTGTFGTGTGQVNLNGNTGVTGTGTFTTGTGAVQLGSLGLGLVQSDATGLLTSGAVDRNGSSFFSNALNVTNGGTGASTFTANGILFGSGSTAIQATGSLANAVLITSGTAAPSLSQTLPLLVQGNITNVGALSAGSIATGFGVISTANAITTTATVTGNIINATGTGAALQLGGNNINSAGTLSNVAYLNQSNTFTGASNTFGGSVAVQGSGGLTLGNTSTAGKLIIANGSGSNLTFTTGAITGNVNLSIPIAASGTTDTICLYTLANCGAAGAVVGTGTQNYIAKFTTTGSNIGNSSLFDNGTFVGINNSTNSSGLLSILGASSAQSGLFVQAAASATTSAAIIKGGATPAAGGDILQLQNSAGTVLAKFDKLGALTAAGATISNLGTGLVTSNASGLLSSGAVDRNSSSYFNTALTATNGGTGLSSLTTNSILYASGTGTFGQISGSAGQVLLANAAGVPTFTTIAGDLGLDGTGAATINKLQGNTLTITTPATGQYLRYSGTAFINSALQAADITGSLFTVHSNGAGSVDQPVSTGQIVNFLGGASTNLTVNATNTRNVTFDIVQNPTFTGTITDSNSSGVALAVTGTPTASATVAQLLLGDGTTFAGSAVANGGTYVGINAPTSGAGSAADFLNFQVAGTSKLKVSNTGLVTSTGGFAIGATTVIDNSRNAVNFANLAASGTVTFSSLTNSSNGGLLVTNATGAVSSVTVDRNSATYFNTALTVANGGTGLTSLTTNSILYATGAASFGQITGTSGQVLLANASGVPTFTTVSGDLGLDGAGAATINKLQGNTLTITTPTTGQYLKYNGSAFVNSALQAADISGTVFSVTGSGANAQTVSSGQTVDFKPTTGGSGNLTVSASATRTVSFDIIQNPTFTGAITASNSTGTALAVSGTPSASATAAQLLFGASGTFTGNASVNGGTYIGVNEPATAAGSAADFVNFQVTGSSKFKITNGGAVTAAGAVTLSSLGTGVVTSNGSGLLSSGAVDRNSSSYFNTALTVANGGTNLTSLTTNSILYATGATSFGQITGTTGQLLLANASGVPTFTTLTGDIGLDGVGATTINKLQGNTLTITTPASGQYLKYNGSAFVNAALAASDLTGTLFTVHGNGTGNVDQPVSSGQTLNLLAGATNNLTVTGSNTRNITFDIITNPSFSGLVTASSNTTALALTGSPVAGTGITSLLQLGGTISGGNTTANGGTYIGINEPATGNGSAADFLNFQANGTTKLKVSAAGLVTASAGYAVGATTVIDSSRNAVNFANLAASGTVQFSSLTNAGAGGLLVGDATGNVSSVKVDRNSSNYFTATQLTVANGGTNLTSLTTNSILYASSSSAFAQIAGTAGQVLLANASGVPTFTTVSGDLGLDGAGSATINKLQGNTLTITTPASGQYLKYNGSAFVNSALQAADIAGTIFNVSGSGANAQAVTTGQTVDFKPAAGGSGNLTVSAGSPRTVSFDIIQNPSFTGAVTASNSTGTALAVTGTPTASATAAQLLLGSSTGFTGNVGANGGTYIGVNEPASGAGSTADFINLQSNGASRFKVSNTGAVTVGTFGAGLVTSNASGQLSSGTLDRNSSTYFNTALTVGNGGTGLSVLSANGVLYADTTTSIAQAAGTSGQVLIAGASGLPSFQSISGDISLSATGVSTINKLQNNTLTISTPSSGQYLRYNGSAFVNNFIQASDVPNLSAQYISNTTTQQVSGNFNIQALSATVAAKIQGASGQDIIDFYGNASATTALAKIDANGNLTAVNGSFTGTLSSGTASSAGSLLLTNGLGQTATIQTGAIAGNTTLSLPSNVGTTDTFCLVSLANCTSTTSAAGSTNYIAKFTSASALGAQTSGASLFDDGTFFGIGTTANNGFVSIQSTSTAQASLFVTGPASSTSPIALIKGGATPGAGADLLQLQNSGGTVLAKIDQNGNVIGNSFDSATAAVLHIGQNTATGIALDKNTVVTGTFKAGSATQFQVDAAGNVATTGTTSTVGLYNTGITQNTAITLGNFATGGSIGANSGTVDLATTINIPQTTAAQTLTLPNPSVIAAGRIVYINATSSADFTIAGQYIIAGQGAAFEWNGSVWTILNNAKAGTGLTQSGNTINSAAPTSVSNDTNIQGSIASNVLTLSFAGTLSTARGGTGLSSYTTNGVLYASGANTLTQAIPASAGQLLLANASNVPTFTSLSGDVSVSGSGATLVNKLQGNTLTITAPATGQYLRYNGSAFVNSAITAADVTGTLFTLTGSTGTSQAVTAGSTVSVLKGASNNLTTTASATNTITVDIVSNPTFSGLITASAGLTIATGQSLTVNGDVINDLTGSGLNATGNALNVDATSSTGFFRNGGNDFGTDATLGTNGAGQTLSLRTAGTNRLTVDASGNLLLQQSSLLAPVANPATNAGGYSLSLYGGAADGTSTGNVGGTVLVQGGGAAGTGNNVGGNVTINGGAGTGTGARGTVLLQTSNTGKVQIGVVTTPVSAYQLELGTNSNTSAAVAVHNSSTGTSAASGFVAYNDNAGSSANFGYFGIGGSSYAAIPVLQNRVFAVGGNGSSGVVVGSLSSNPTIFVNNSLEVARFDSSGNFTQSGTYNLTSGGQIQGASFRNSGGSFAVNATGNVTTALSATTGTTLVCQNASSQLSGCTNTYAQTNDTTNFIRNQTGVQASSNFNISGTGVANILQAPTFDAATSGALSIGTTNATQINLNKNTVVTGSLSVSAGITSNQPLTNASGYAVANNFVSTLTPASASIAGSSTVATTNGVVATGPNVNANTAIIGLQGYAQNNSTNTLGAATGILGQVYSGNNITSAISVNSQIFNTGTGTFTNSTGLQASTPAFFSTGTITTATGLNIQAQKVAGVGTGYGIVQSGAADLNTFAGATTFSGTGTALTVNNNAAISGSLTGNNASFTATSATQTPLFVQAAANATVPAAVIKGGATPGAGGDLLQVQNSAGTQVVSINSFGTLFAANGLAVGGSAAAGAATTLNTGASGNIGAVIKGNSVQTADLLQFQSSSAILGGVNATGQLYSGTGANTTTLAFTAPSGANTITFPAATGTVCLTTTCATGTAGSYIQNQSASAQAANFFIQGAASTVAAVIQGAASQDITDFKNSAGTVVAKIDSTGSLTATGATISSFGTGLVKSNASGVLSSGTIDRNSSSYFAATQLTVANGGTNLTSLTTNSILYASSTSAFAQITGTAGQVLLANASGVPTFTTLTGDIGLDGAGATTINKLQGNTLTITTPASGQYLRYNGSAFVNAALGSGDITGTIFSVTGSGANAQTVSSGQTVDFKPTAGGSGNLTVAASATRTVSFDIIQNPTFTGAITASNSAGIALAVTGTPTASATAAQLLFGASGTFTGNASVSGGTYIGVNEPAAGAGSAADFLNFQVAGTSKLKVSNTGLVTSTGGFAIGATTVIDSSRNATNFANLAASGSVTFSSINNSGAGGILSTNSTGVVSSSFIDRDTSPYLTGTLSVANGGTGATTLAANGVLVGNGTTAVTTKTGTSGQVLLANGSNVPTFTSLSGDVSVSSTGATLVNKLQGSTLTITTPATGQYLRYNGSAFVNAAITSSDVSGTFFSVTGSGANPQTVSAGQTVDFAPLAGGSGNITVAASATRQISIDITQAPTFTGTLTASKSGGAIALTGVPTATATVAQILFGASGTFTGNAAVNGGTYVGVNEPSSGAGSAADFLNFQVAGTSKLKVDNNGVISTAGGLTVGGTVTIDASRNATFATLTTTGSAKIGNLTTTGFVTTTDGLGTLSSGTVNRDSSSYFTGTLSTGNGGTGLTSYTTNGVLYASGANTLTQTTGTDGKVLLSNAGVPTFTALSGDVTVTGSGVTNVAKLQGSTLTITTPSTNQYLKYNGSAFVNSAITSSDITGTLFSVTGTGANPQTISAGQTLDFAPLSGGSGNITVAANAIRQISIDITQAPTFTGTLTASKSGGAIALTGVPTAAATSAQLLFGAGASFTGNTSANGGTYIGVNEPSSGAGSAADFLNFQIAGTSKLKVDSTGVITTAGGLTVGATVTIDSARNATLAALTATSAKVSNLTTTGFVTTTDGLGTLSSGTVNRDSSSYFSGTLSVSNGGTGVGTLAAGSLVIGNGASPVSTLAAGTNNQFLQSNGTTPGYVTLSGDASLSAGLLTVNKLQGKTLTIGATPVLNDVLLYNGSAFVNQAIGGDLSPSAATAGSFSVAKLQGNNLTITAPATGQYLRYNGSAFVNAGITATDVTGTLFNITGSGANAQTVASGQTVDFAPLAGGSGNITVAASATRQISIDITQAPTFASGTFNTSAGSALAVSGTPTAAANRAQLIFGAAGTFNGDASANGGTYIGINEPATAAGSAADFLNFQVAGVSKLKVSNSGLINTVSGLSISGVSAIDSARNGSLAQLTTSGTNKLGALTTTGFVTTTDGLGTLSSGTVNRDSSSYFSGTLSVPNGGTGLTTIASNALLIGNGTGSVSSLAAGTVNQFLQSNGTSASYVSLSGDANLSVGVLTVNKLQGKTLTIGVTPVAGDLLLYNGSAFVNQAVTGDVTISGTGVTTIGAGKVTNTQLQNKSITFTSSAANSNVLVNGSTSSTVDLGTTLTLATVNNPTFTGQVTGSSAVTGLALTGAPSNNGTSSILQLGSAIAGGNSVANGGTYLGINLPASGTGSAADFLNFQAAGTVKLTIDSNGLLNARGGFSVGAAAGVALSSCSGYLNNPVFTGGILTSGACASTASSINLQAAYNNSGATSPQILLNSAYGGIKIADGATPVGSGVPLIDITNNGGTVHYFNVTATQINESVPVVNTAAGNSSFSGKFSTTLSGGTALEVANGNLVVGTGVGGTNDLFTVSPTNVTQTFNNTSGSALNLTTNNVNTGNTTSTINALNVTLGGSTNTNGNFDNTYGLNLTANAATGSNYYGININGSQFKDVLTYNGTQLISGAVYTGAVLQPNQSGKIQNAAFDPAQAYSNINKVGTLTVGAISPGFGVISTSNTISTSAALYGGTIGGGSNSSTPQFNVSTNGDVVLTTANSAYLTVGAANSSSIGTFYVTSAGNVNLTGTSASPLLKVTSTPNASTGTSLIEVGSALNGAASAAGGTYLGINAPTAGAGSASDFLNFQHNGVTQLQVTAGGALTAVGAIQGASVTATNAISAGTTVNAGTTYKIGGSVGTAGQYLRSDGSTGFVASTIAPSDGAGSFLLKAPTTTANNTITPAAGVVGLTVQGVAGQHIADFSVGATITDFFDVNGSLNLGASVIASSSALDLGTTTTAFRTGYFNTSVNTPSVTTLSAGSANGITIQPGASTTAAGTGATTLVQGGNQTGGGASTGGTVTIVGGTGTTNGVVNIGTTTTSALNLGAAAITTTNNGNFTVQQVLTANGAVSIAANQNLSLQAGTGVFTQGFTSGNGAGNAQNLNLINNNTAAGATTQGTVITPTNATTPSSGFNTLNGINFATGTLVGSNVTNGINFASTAGYSTFINSPSFKLTNLGAVSGVTTLATTGIITVGTFASSTATYLCNNAGQIASCNTAGAGAAFVQGGNNFGATAVLGTQDTFNLQLNTANTARVILDQANNFTFQAASTVTTAAGGLTLTALSGQNITVQSQGAGILNLTAGSGGIVGTSTGTISLTAAAGATASLDAGAAGAVNIGAGNAAKTIQIGNAANAVTNTIGIGNNATAGSVTNTTIGSTTANSSLVLQGITTKTTYNAIGTSEQATTDTINAFNIQNSVGAMLFTTDTTNSANGTNLSVNSGAETSATFATNWAGFGSSTVSRTTTAGEFVAGTAGVKAVVTATTSGAKNNLGAALSTNTTYLVSFTVKSGTAGDSIRVLNVPTGGANDASTGSCTTAIAITIAFSKVNCTLITSATVGNASAALAIVGSLSANTYFVDNFSIVQQLSGASNAINSAQLRVGGVNGQGLTLLTVDNYAGRPTTSATPNAALLGSIYYDTTLGKMQCYEATGWGYCGASPDVSVNLVPEYTGAVLNGTGIGSLTSDICSYALAINKTTGSQTCANPAEDYNYYSWSTIQPTNQVYSVYIRYQLPATFKSISGNVSLTARRTAAITGDNVAFSMYDALGNQCGSTVALTDGAGVAANTWSPLNITPTVCTLAANGIVLFKIDVTAVASGGGLPQPVYVSNLSFLAKGQ